VVVLFLLSLLSVSEDEEWWSEPSIAPAFPVVATFLHLREMQRRLESAGEENEGVDEEEGGVHLLPALIRAHVHQHLPKKQRRGCARDCCTYKQYSYLVASTYSHPITAIATRCTVQTLTGRERWSLLSLSRNGRKEREGKGVEG
jgi:hypothetical protein